MAKCTTQQKLKLPEEVKRYGIPHRIILTFTVIWTLLGWVLGRYAGRPGVITFAILALGSAGNLIKHPQLLREGIGLLPLLVSMGVGALVCLHSARRHPGFIRPSGP